MEEKDSVTDLDSRREIKRIDIKDLEIGILQRRLPLVGVHGSRRQSIILPVPFLLPAHATTS